jgi:hypothetical protein
MLWNGSGANAPEPEDIDEPTLRALTTLSGKPLALGKLTLPAKKAVDEVMEWLRFNSPDPSIVDDPTAQALANLASIPCRAV